ncbi:carbohydrate-binding protein [Thaumasiovibrio sp. DFM-14]|uniref:carbohydrate-binding protein n=1 Tax=Thaumasiovibrio sp. DFM-14 TaxID=3384792 RepID=UPI0039A28BEF
MIKKLITTAILLSISTAGYAEGANGGMQNFLDSLRNFESGINPELADFYTENYDNPVYNYAQVTAPGRLVRDCSTGSMISEPTTIREYFQKLGLDSIYNPATPTSPEMFKEMQFNSTNAWGFIGYQLGEAVLIDSGYYSPQTVNIDGNEYDSFYMFVPDSTWIGCRTEALAEIEGSGGNQVYVTDNNRWLGTFTGKNGVSSLDGLKVIDNQEMVIRDAMHFNYGIISKLLADADMTWEQVFQKSWTGTDTDGNTVEVLPTMSGILAAAHLRGAWGTASLLIEDKITCDEIGTCITTYVYKFGGYNTLFDVPGDSVTQGSKYDEVLYAGWGNDTVILGGGSNTLQLNEQAKSITTVKDFRLDADRIVLSGWVQDDPLGNVVISDTGAGAELQFGNQTVILENITADSINAVGVENLLFKSNVYTMSWQGTYVVDDFNPAVDKIKGSAGIGFKHLKAYQTANSIVIGPQAADGGIYASYELIGLTLADLHPDMFVDVTGSFDRLGFIVPLNWLTWGWNSVLEVGYFDVEKTVLTVPADQPIPFSAVKLTQEGSNVVLSLLDPFAQGDKKKVIISHINVDDLTADNFSGFSGDFSEITTENAIVYVLSVTVSTTGGTVSPTPDELGQLYAKGGEAYTVLFVPDSGYQVASIILDGVEQPLAASLTIPNVSSNMSLSVAFEEGSGNVCALPWSPTEVYNSGDQVSYNEIIYEAQWWTMGNEPDQGGPWKVVGSC